MAGRDLLKSGLKFTLGISCPNGFNRSSVESADRHTVFTDRSNGDSRFVVSNRNLAVLFSWPVFTGCEKNNDVKLL